jgi:hypothetical protein
MALVVCGARRRGVVERVAGVQVRAELDEQFDGVQVTATSGAPQRRFTARLAVDAGAQFHQRANTVRTVSFGELGEESLRVLQERRIARDELTDAIRVVSVAGDVKFLRFSFCQLVKP